MPYPWMTLTTRTDSDDIFAYLRTLPPVEHQRPANTLIEPLKLGIAMDGWDLLFFKPKTFEPNSDKSAAWNRGAYLVTGLGHCGACHTQVDRFGAAESGKMLQGGTLDTWYAPAIDKAGLADWRIPDIVTYLKTGRNARALAAGPMADVITHSTQFLTDADLSAIATYLKDAPSGAATQASGEGQADGKIRTAGMAIYRDNCAACHGADGNGASNLIPSLHQDGVVLGRDPVGILHVVLHGAVGNATQWAPSDPGMPGFGWKLSDAEVAAVATYIRSAWGNKADPVDSATAHDLRERLH
jgi:mono/diheme cytochrome c family protein